MKVARRAARTLLAALLVPCGSGFGTPACATALRSLLDMDLEELGNVQITSVSKQPQRLADAPASVFVITAEDIERAGARSLPEALRLAPNLQVARISNSQYAVSARGFNGFRNNKLLVQIDGRGVYSPSSSVVFWEQQLVLLDDIERIEVISGPGGTIWGLNAVNGIINVITRPAPQTQGTLVHATAGTDGRSLDIRHGFGTSEDAAINSAIWRLNAQSVEWNNSRTLDGRTVEDATTQQQIGFRVDGKEGHDQWNVLGQAFKVSAGQPPPGFFVRRAAPSDIQTSGLNLVGQWQRPVGDDGQLQWQFYLDSIERVLPNTLIDQTDKLDLQLLHAFTPTAAHRLIWGGEFRLVRNAVRTWGAMAYVPEVATQQWLSAFAQDEWALTAALRLTLGSRIETNPYTHAEWLPNIRLAWTPVESQLIWAAVSKAARSPSRVDVDLRFPAKPPYLSSGDDGFRTEKTRATELGYRGQLSDRLSLALTLFYNHYDQLLTVERGPSGNHFTNQRFGDTCGAEWWAMYQPAPSWRVSAGWSGLKKKLKLEPGVIDLNLVAPSGGNDPDSQWRASLSHDFSEQWSIDWTVRHVSKLPAPAIAAYTVADVRVAFKPREGLEVAVAGTNLFGGRHEEFALTNVVNPTASVSPQVALTLVTRF
jgi:iron complex outermembrane receptor protein